LPALPSSVASQTWQPKRLEFLNEQKGQHNYVRLNIRPPDHPVHIKIWLKKFSGAAP